MESCDFSRKKLQKVLKESEMELKYRDFCVETGVFCIFRIFAKIRGEQGKSADSGNSRQGRPFSLSFLKDSREFSKETLRTGCRAVRRNGDAVAAGSFSAVWAAV
ncbi:MAG: hypothetical protein NC344_06145 [Bacteroidales bacterium]|nr:hypothetical protein [Bacteroidales bacterium]MCM1147398.1 hypothetical protein [Bacteroidales bacterium]